MSARRVIALPEVPTAGDAALHWWRVENSAIVESGVGDEWLAEAQSIGQEGAALVALAPSAAVRLIFSYPQGVSDRQAVGIVRAAAMDSLVADPATVHAVADVVAADQDGDPASRKVVTAIVANGTMIAWLDWFEALGADPLAIIPAGLIVPRTDDWRTARVGGEEIVARGDLVFPHDPAIAEALIGADGVTACDPADIEQRIVAAAIAPPLDLRRGRFARRRLLLLDWRRVRELAALAAAIPLIGLIIALALIIRLNLASDRLDAETAALASRSLGRPVTVEVAATQLDARSIETGRGVASPFALIAILYRQLQLSGGVQASALEWRGDGTLTTTLAAPRAEDLNPVLIGLQSAGYDITAVPRQSTDGRSLAAVTIRSGP